MFFVVTIGWAQSPWTVRNSRAGGDDLWGIASGPAGVVAVGTNGAILQSADGQTWTRRASGTTDWLTAVTFGNNRFIAVGDHGRILSSADGVTWTNVAQAATSQRLNNVAYGFNKFVAVGEAGTILTSSDGATWKVADSGTTSWLRGLAFGFATTSGHVGDLGGGRWLATGQGGTLLISSDAITWKASASDTTADLEGVAFVSGTYERVVSSAGNGNMSLVVAGENGITRLLTLNTIDTTFSSAPLGIGTASRIRALASGASSSFAYSTVGGASFHGLSFAAPCVALDETGSAFSNYTTDASGMWTRESLPTTALLRAVTYSATQNSFYAVGTDETIVQRDEVFTGRLGNISTRGSVTSDAKPLIAGFVVRGAAAKSILVRAIGPTLAAFGVSNSVSQPVLTVYDSAGKVVARNTRWGTNTNPTALADTMRAAGAFALAPESADSALQLTVSPGGYTAVVTGGAGSSGAALVEIYDLSAEASGTSRAINLSSNGVTGSGDNAFIAGLVVRGPLPRKFLVRAVGPGLTAFGVTGVLPDPVATLLSAQFNPVLPGSDALARYPLEITQATLVRTTATLAAATAAVGAFPLEANGRDDQYLITLPPGTYTFQVSSQGNSSGIALIEIYDVGPAQ
jgi:hypothetical protein